MYDPDDELFYPPRAPIGFKATKPNRAETFEGNPWLTIWTEPRSTIRYIVDTDPSRNVILLASLMGIGGVVSNSFKTEMGSLGVIGLSLILGSLFGILMVYVYGAVISWTGGWLGGVATQEQVRAAYAWSNVPVIPVTVIGLGMLLIPDRPDSFLFLFKLAHLILGIWGFVLFLNCLAEVHEFSRWTAFGAMILGGLVTIVLIIVFVAIVFGALSVIRSGLNP